MSDIESKSNKKIYYYDVCLSFAGEDRSYVEEVADTLMSSGVKIFYDLHEQASLWGKDLYQHLDKIYRESAAFCVIFISENYSKKLWTKHELRSAQARAFRENREYILPARFDSTELPGIPETIGFVDLKKISPNELAQLIINKLKNVEKDLIINNTESKIHNKKPYQNDIFDALTNQNAGPKDSAAIWDGRLYELMKLGADFEEIRLDAISRYDSDLYKSLMRETIADGLILKYAVASLSEKSGIDFRQAWIKLVNKYKQNLLHGNGKDIK